MTTKTITPVPPVAYREGWTIEGRPLTYSAAAPAEIAGTTVLHWEASHDGRVQITGPVREVVLAAIDERIEEDRPTVVTFASGATRTVRAALAERLLGLSEEGRIVVRDDWADYNYGLTLCCNAYDKGYEWGVGCRACGGDDAGEYDAVVVDPKV